MHKIRIKYFSRAKRIGRLLRFVPFIRLAGLNGSMVRGEETKESDIDFLIVAKDNRLYSTRFFATVFVHLTGWRRHGQKVAGRICLNCYLSASDPDISPKNKKSRFKVAKAYKYLIPLAGDKKTAEKFFQTNRWFNYFKISGAKYSQNLERRLTAGRPLTHNKIFEYLLYGRFGDWLEKKLMVWQKKRILAGAKDDDETVATIKEIRLHPVKNSKIKIQKSKF